MRDFLSREVYIIIHNGARYDLPVLEKLLGIEIKAKIIDSLPIAWAIDPDRSSYGLESYGIDFGIPKPEIEDWEFLTPEKYRHRCEEDVKINSFLWKKLWRRLSLLYKNEEQALKYCEYLTFKMRCAQRQEEARWKLDVDKAKELYDKLVQEKEEKVIALKWAMPRIPIIQEKTKPTVLNKKDGTLSKRGQEWFDLLKELNLPENTEVVNVVKGYEEPNPSSTPQLKAWLKSLGWKPQTLKTVVNKQTGESRQVEQINLPNGGGVCESVLELVEKDENVRLLDGLSVLGHRIPLVRGFLNAVDSEGYIKAQVQGLTNTLRFIHAVAVNIPRIDRPYGKEIRSLLTAPEGYELCGSDMKSLEDRLKQHYIYPLDPDYVNEMNKEDWDPHLDLALSASAVTINQVIAYKSEIDTSIKPIRSIFKNGNYACQYGAGPPRLAITCNVDLSKAKEIHEAYWKRNWAIKEVASQQVIKEVDGYMWLLNPVNKYYYFLKYKKDVFSTLVQGTASYVFDLWIAFVLKQRDQLTFQFHDEGGWTIPLGFRKEMTKILTKAIDQTNKVLKLNRELGIDIQFGPNYAAIH